MVGSFIDKICSFHAFDTPSVYSVNVETPDTSALGCFWSSELRNECYKLLLTLHNSAGPYGTLHQMVIRNNIDVWQGDEEEVTNGNIK